MQYFWGNVLCNFVNTPYTIDYFLHTFLMFLHPHILYVFLHYNKIYVPQQKRVRITLWLQCASWMPTLWVWTLAVPACFPCVCRWDNLCYWLLKSDFKIQAISFSLQNASNADLYFFTGYMLGQAVFNCKVVDLPFPIALFKKLLNV